MSQKVYCLKNEGFDTIHSRFGNIVNKPLCVLICRLERWNEAWAIWLGIKKPGLGGVDSPFTEHRT